MDRLSQIKKRALSSRVGTVCASLGEMVSRRDFVLTDNELLALEQRSNQLIDGWVFAYRAVRFEGHAQSSLLQQGLLSDNPRIREHACDLIGDLGLNEAAELLRPLFEDEDASVSDAAIYNYRMLLT